jgi:hypothetical protein
MMNKLLLTAFLAVAVLGCKKDTSRILKINDDLMGKWSLQLNKMEYYDQTGQKEYEEVMESTSIAAQINFMKGARAQITTRSAEVLNTAYNLAQENGIVYIELYDAAIFDAQVWKISELPADEMTWKAGFTNIKYEDRETGEIVEAPKAELTLKFSKQ